MIELSAIDRARFGVRVAKATPGSQRDWREALAFCASNSVELLIARIETVHVALAQRMQADGAFLTDVLVLYRRASLAEVRARPLPQLRIRPCEPHEADSVKALARRCFHGYLDHYHADPRLARDACDELYADWAHRSCLDRRIADEVLVAEEGARIVGFAALRMSSPLEADGMLFGVDPDARRRGVFGALVRQFIAWAGGRGARSAIYSTQLANAATHKTLARCGFAVESSHFTFHKWFQSRRHT